MGGYGLGPYGGGPFGIGGTTFGKLQNFQATTSFSNVISLNWGYPDNYTASTQTITILRTKTHYPMELSDPRAVEVFKGDAEYSDLENPFFDIHEIYTGTTTNVGENLLEDTAADYSTLVGPSKIMGDLSGGIVENDGNIFIIKSNTSTQLFLEPSPVNPITQPTSGSYRIGLGLEDNTFYYYTAFTDTGNEAKAIFGLKGSTLPTQISALSMKNENFGDRMLNVLLPDIYKTEDITGDLRDFLEVIGNSFNKNHAEIGSFNLTNPLRMKDSVLESSNFSLGFDTNESTIGIDTMRRISQNIVQAWKLKGTREGLALFIRIITTWCLTDPLNQIFDNIGAGNYLQTFKPDLLGSTIHLYDTGDETGARLLKKLPIVIPIASGKRAYLVTIPDVAINAGISTNVTTTTLEDASAPFVGDLSGNFLFPSETEPTEFFEIKSNTTDTITIEDGQTILNLTAGNNYFILSPLNTQRYLRLLDLIRIYEPYFSYGFVTFI